MIPMIKAKQVKKIFPGPLEILKEISFELPIGQSMAITGKSGCGKSTLLHILGTLDAPTSGDIEIEGESLTSFAAARREKIGFVFQAFHLLEDYSLLDNVLMPAKIARKPTHPSSESYNHAMFLLEQVDLLDRLSIPVKFLSGGEKQRACIARALCNSPKLLLADEPTGNLDPNSALHIQEILLSCSQKHGKSLILVTHDREFASLCDQHYLLQDGRLELLP